MKKLKLSLEYQCYPIWSYDEDGSLIVPYGHVRHDKEKIREGKTDNTK